MYSMKCSSFPRQQGFTLLEVMIALAILAISLTGLFVVVGNSIRTSYHARMMSQATLLCRYKLAEIEEEFLQRGFSDQGLSVEQEGAFFEGAENNPFDQDRSLKENYGNFQYRYTIEKIQLPGLEQMLGGFAGNANLGSSEGSSAKSGSGMAGGPDFLINQVKSTIEQKVRKVTMQVLWEESGRGPQKLEVVAFYTDPNLAPMGATTQPLSGSPSSATPPTTSVPAGSTATGSGGTR